MRSTPCATAMIGQLCALLALSLWLGTASWAVEDDAYSPTSDYLRAPEKLLPHIAQVGDFWLGAVDVKHGGVFTDLGPDGTPVETHKHTLRQSRAAYGLMRAFQVTGNEQYLTAAEGILDFLYAHAWDEEHGGWYAMVDRQGRVDSKAKSSERSAYVEHYAMLGIVTMVEATASPRQRRRLAMARSANDRLWDERPDVGGYFANAQRDWSGRRGKSFTAEADAITAHLLADYLRGRTDDRRDRLRAVGDNLPRIG